MFILLPSLSEIYSRVKLPHLAARRMLLSVVLYMCVFATLRYVF